MKGKMRNRFLAAMLSFVMIFSIIAQIDVVKAAEPYENVVAHYDMTVEDGKLVDVSGNGNDAALVDLSADDIMTEEDGSKVLQFNGKGYVKIPDCLDGNAATIQMIYQIGEKNNEGLLTLGTKNASTSGLHYLRFHPNTDAVTFLWESELNNQNNAKVTGNVTYSEDEYAVATAVISEEGTLTYYLNGKKYGTMNMNGVSLQNILDSCDDRTDAIGFIGRPAWANHDPYFSGKLKSFEIYNYAVAEEEILWNTRTGTSPVADYDMTLTEDGKLKDASGFGFDATMVGLDTNNIVTDGGKTVLDFGTTGGYVELPSGIIQGNDITIQATFKMNAEDNSALWTLGTMRDNGTYTRLHPATGSSLLFESIHNWGGAKTEISDADAAIATNAYVTVTTVIYESGIAIIYLGGEEIGRVENVPKIQDVLTGGVDSETVIGWIGRPIWSNDPAFTGKLARFTVYETALTSDDVFMSTLEYETSATSTRIVSNLEPKDVPNATKENEWREAMVTGNGNNGLLHLGYPYSDSFIYQNINLIMPSTSTRENPDFYWQLDTVRQALINMDEAAIPQIGRSFFYAYHPGATLRMDLDESITNGGAYSNYERWTNYETAEVGVTYANNLGVWERSSFTSGEDDVTITKFEKSSTGTKISMEISLDNVSQTSGFHGDPTNMQYKKIVSDDASFISLVGKYPGNGDYSKGELKDGGYVTTAQVIVVGGTKEKVLNAATSRDSQNVGTENDPRIKITDADAVYIVSRTDRTWDMCTFDAFKAKEQYNLLDELIAQVSAVTEKYSDENGFSYEAALAPHAESFGEEFNKVKFSLNAEEEDIKTSTEDLMAKQNAAWDWNLNDAMVERAYNSGRYIELCCAGYTAPRLSGMWTGQFNGGWRYIYTLDANVNLQVSPMNTGNMKSAAEGYIYFILRHVDDFMDNAYMSYRMHDAIQPSVNTDGDSAIGIESDWLFPFAYWNAGSSWLLLPIYEYWQCYGNQQIPLSEGVDLYEARAALGVEDGGLSVEEVDAIMEKGYMDLEQDILLPLLTKQANFWEQLMTPEYYMDADGNPHYEEGKTELDVEAGERYMITPSYSPENAPREDGGYTWNHATTMNSTMDIAAAKDGLKMVMDLEKAVGREGYEDAVEKWSNLQSLLPEYQYDGELGSEETYYGGGGALREWATPIYMEENRHRHISHMYVAWPAYETQDNERLAAGAAQSMKNRDRLNSGGEKTTGHGWMHNALVYGRLKDSEGVYESLYQVINSNIFYSSMVTDHNTYRQSNTYCTDTAIGLVAVINEALLFSNTGEIELVPALPQQWETGSMNGLMARTRAEVEEMSWNLTEGTVNAVIRSDADQEIELSCGMPWTDVSITGNDDAEITEGEVVVLNVKAGDKVTVQFTIDPVLAELIYKLDAEENEYLDSTIYTKETWAAYEKAIADAKALLAEDEVTQEEATAAIKAIEDAKEGLVEIVIDLPEVVADFNFDEDGDVFDGGYAQATGTYTLVDHGNGKALKLDGNNQYLTLKNKDGGSLIVDTDELTVSFWINPEESATNWGFFAAPNAGTQTYLSEKYIGVFDNNGSIIAERYNSNNQDRPANPSKSVGYGEWYHVTAVYTEAETILYVNGEEAAREASSVDISNLLGKKSVAYIGRSTWGAGECYTGLIDDFKIYSRALSADEVAAEAVEKTDKSVLETLIKEAIPETDKDKYTTDTWTVYEKALADAKKILADENATQTAVDAALQQLQSTMDKLEEVVELPYEDVSEADWFYDAVAYTFYEEIMTGMDATHFGPYGQLSRAQFALILYRIEGEPTVETDKSFGDIIGDEWYGPAVLWAAENGIVTGYQNGNFGPADNITREQMAVMMYRYAYYISQCEAHPFRGAGTANYMEKDTSKKVSYDEFADAANVSDFAEEAMQWVVAEKIITGKENGTMLDPQGNTARCEAAAIIQRYIQ